MQYESTEIGPRTQDLTGKTFERLTVLHFAGYRVDKSFPRGRPYWTCQCSCNGQKLDVLASNLKRGNTQSCGCLQRERTGNHARRHGKSQTSEHNVWAGMMQRCYNPKSQDYPNYGGRGITVCDAWHHFATFYQDMAPRPSSKHTLERVHNNQGYSLSNCIWAVQKVQSRNMRTNVLLTYNNITQCLADWAIATNLSADTIQDRLKRGLSLEMALTLPPRSRRKR